MSPARRKVFYFSFRSPYSWMAHRLAEQIPDLDIEYRPFFEPDLVTEALLAERGGSVIYTPMSREKHLYMLQDVRRLAGRLGFPLTWPVDREPWWEPSHLGYLLADRNGAGPDFRRAVYRARWEEGRDIGRADVIGEIAADLGLDAAAAAAAPADPDLRAAGAHALLQCHRDGVFGVPFFLVGREKFWGVDRFTDFVGALNADPTGADVTPRYASVEAQRLAGTGARTTDIGHAGGCG